MTLTFADTHNMITYLTKSDASEGFNQIIDFLNASSIKYALTVNPNIYVSCIKQFWSSISVKKVNDVVHLQALIDRKKMIITEATVREALRLDDAESIDCLPNEEIFTELLRMGYEKPSMKLTFYKAFFSAQWKFLIHTLLQCMSAKRTSWNEFSSSMASAVICLSTGILVPQQAAVDVDDVVADSVPIDDVAADVHVAVAKPTPSSPPPTIPPPQDLPSTSQVVPTPPPTPISQPSSPPQQQQPSQPTIISMDLFKQFIRNLYCPNQKRLNPLQIVLGMIRRMHPNRGIIADIDANKDVTLKEVEVEKTTKVEKDADVQGRLEESQARVYHIDLEHANKVLSMQDDEPEPVELQEVIEVVTTAKLMTEVVTAATTTITAATTNITAVAPIIVATITDVPSAARRRKGAVIRDPVKTAGPSIIIHSEPKSKDKGKGIMVEEPKPLKKQAQIEQDEAYARKLEAELNKNINWDDVIKQVKETGKQDNVVLRYQALKRKPQTKAQARKNMMVYLKNMARFKMDYFKGMRYDDIHPIFKKFFNSNVAHLEKSKEHLEEEESRALKRQSESLEEKAVKKQKSDEEVEELKKYLQIVPNDDDDVYTKATPFARNVSVVDYEIYSENNKPSYKIIRDDGSHQLFLSFLSLLRNFDREYLEVLWKLVQEIFASSKPKNFLDNFLLTTLTYMFKKPDVKAQVWKNQRSVHGLAKVKIWRLLELCRLHIIAFITT
nr:hypothetical protein [Tanacetum cinerariifolium]